MISNHNNYFICHQWQHYIGKQKKNIVFRESTKFNIYVLKSKKQIVKSSLLHY